MYIRKLNVPAAQVLFHLSRCNCAHKVRGSSRCRNFHLDAYTPGRDLSWYDVKKEKFPNIPLYISSSKEKSWKRVNVKWSTKREI